MFDRVMRNAIDPPLNYLGRALVQFGVTANSVTIAGLVMATIAAVAIAVEAYGLGLLFLLLSRLADGLDGAVARASQTTDFGGYLDITSDFFFYGLIPFAFIVSNLHENGIAGAFLLLSFYVNGASFLGYAILAEKYGIETKSQGVKSLYYSNGLLEGTETIVFFVALCSFPAQFSQLAWVFGGLCFLTAGTRVFAAYQIFDHEKTNRENE